ncbi:toxin-antitoxin system YwqK family antitoxin [Robertkochia solimangrovi]|uniref:toxin-antitoxin system YwqK family antitoxin n=1 Tax=Robertkochia solimangrovi TaxID=2213046 RepID=UPI00117E4864|nr:hypothetical protein [Robertkochia solimangrovi]TRZ41881.1 hypothetical protein DMZ48_16180 [Robertkochia solimangrovi]
MKIFCLFFVMLLASYSYSQDPDQPDCNCAELTFKGKTGKSAYKGNIPFSGICEKTRSGAIIQQSEFQNGQLDGETKNYYPNGIVKETYTYSKNQKHGVYQRYNDEGKLLTEGWYLNDLKHGEWSYYNPKTGIVLKVLHFEFGKQTDE